MKDEIITGMVTVGVGIIGLAIFAVIVGQNSRTGDVIQAGGQAFTNALKVAVSPVTGGSGFPESASVGYSY